MKNKIFAFLVTTVITVILTAIYLGISITNVDPHEFGFAYNRFTGKIEKIERTGWVFKAWPIYSVSIIDTRPFQVTMSANSRILNAKLVRFNPAGIEDFIQWHGRNAGDSKFDLEEILKSYAFAPDGGVNCTFLQVVDSTGAVLEPVKK